MHILVAIDPSTESHNALENALDIVSTFDGSVTAVHAADDDGQSIDSDAPAEGTGGAQKTDHGAEVLENAVERAANHDISIETEVLVGDPVRIIVDYAEENDVDVIYIGHRGLSGEAGELSGERRGPLGSVAKGVVERTQIPVTVFDRGL